MLNTSTKLLQLDQIAARKEHNAITQMIAALPDSFTAWIECYMNLTVLGVRNDEIADKIILHLSRFATYFQEQYGQERLSHCLKRDVQAWQTHLSEDWAMAASTVNNHLATPSVFCTWVHAEEKRRVSPLHPHALRHTFGNMLAKVTQADEYELERRLGHHSRRYIKVYTNPPEQVAASYIEGF
jgi:site-specific recombinase XerD